MCQSHWDMLREEVKSQGMGDLISANGDIVTMKMVAELQAEPGTEERVEDFDPLMRCWFMIMNRTLEMVGLPAMTEEFGCPICRLNEMRTEDGQCGCDEPGCEGKFPGAIPDHETWLHGESSCVVAVKEMCVERGWL